MNSIQFLKYTNGSTREMSLERGDLGQSIRQTKCALALLIK